MFLEVFRIFRQKSRGFIPVGNIIILVRNIIIPIGIFLFVDEYFYSMGNNFMPEGYHEESYWNISMVNKNNDVSYRHRW